MAEAATSFIIGWEEWVALPDLGLPAIKAKVDTGAKTSALHAFLIEPFGPADQPMVRFGIRPIPGRDDIEIYCSAPIVDRREVTSSNGERETRYVIRTGLTMGARSWQIEATLTNRETMAYRMLIGRQAIREDMYVDPAASFLQPKLSYRLYRHLPRHDLVHRPLRIAILTRQHDSPSNRRLAAAASARGHVLELLDTSLLALVFDLPVPGLVLGGKPLAHYDAVIPRLSTEDGTFGPAIVRQLEMMGCYAVNSGDALDRLANPLRVVQVLARAGVPHRMQVFAAEDANRGRTPVKAPASHYKFLVVDGRAAAAMQRRHGKDFDAGARKLKDKQVIAERAAAALELGLASVHVTGTDGRPCVLRVSATPALGTFERITGARVAEAIISSIELGVRSWVRRTGPLAAGVGPTGGSPPAEGQA